MVPKITKNSLEISTLWKVYYKYNLTKYYNLQVYDIYK